MVALLESSGLPTLALWNLLDAESRLASLASRTSFWWLRFSKLLHTRPFSTLAVLSVSVLSVSVLSRLHPCPFRRCRVLPCLFRSSLTFACAPQCAQRQNGHAQPTPLQHTQICAREGLGPITCCGFGLIMLRVALPLVGTGVTREGPRARKGNKRRECVATRRINSIYMHSVLTWHSTLSRHSTHSRGSTHTALMQ